MFPRSGCRTYLRSRSGTIRVGDTVEETNYVVPRTLSRHGRLYRRADRSRPRAPRPSVSSPGIRKDLLKKDMYVDAVIHMRAAHVLAVPTSGDPSQRRQNSPFRVRRSASRESSCSGWSTLGTQHGDDTEITGGLKQGEKVVSEGSVFLQFANIASSSHAEGMIPVSFPSPYRSGSWS